MPLADYPIAVPDPLILQASAPATITAPTTGVVIVRHYWGNSAREDGNRLWVDLPAASAGEVTDGVQVRPWPGNEVRIRVTAAQEIRVGINGISGSSWSDPPNASPTFFNDGNNARVIVDDTLPGGWGRYIEWEDLVLTGSNNHFNDSRTLIWYAGGWVVGAIGRR